MFNPLPARGYTKSRTGVAKPLRLDLDFIGNRLSETRPRLGYVAVRTPPMPYRLLKLAEDHA
jgi:hypothetical protein